MSAALGSERAISSAVPGRTGRPLPGSAPQAAGREPGAGIRCAQSACGRRAQPVGLAACGTSWLSPCVTEGAAEIKGAVFCIVPCRATCFSHISWLLCAALLSSVIPHSTLPLDPSRVLARLPRFCKRPLPLTFQIK